MDTQRLILFVVFSFAVLLLWDAWQKDHQPTPQAPATSASSTVPAQAPVSTPGQQLVPPTREPATVGDGLARGLRAKVKTDVLNAVIDANGGDIRRLEFVKYGDSLDPKKHFLLFEEQKDKLYVAQTGLIGASLPSHRAQFTLTPGDYVLGPSSNEVKVRLEWSDPSGLQVSKIYTFHRGSYLIDVTYEIQNLGPSAVEPYAYYQLLRHGKPPAGDPKFVSTYTGVAVYTDKEKYQKVAFPDIDKGKQSYPRYSDDGWIAMLHKGWSRRDIYSRRGRSGRRHTARGQQDADRASLRRPPRTGQT
jgi:YidC/Oxa1 family membrane protein insertase